MGTENSEPKAQNEALNSTTTITDPFILKKAYLQDLITLKTGLQYETDFKFIESQSNKYQKLIIKCFGHEKIGEDKKKLIEAIFDEKQIDMAPMNPKRSFTLYLKDITVPPDYRETHLPPKGDTVLGSSLKQKQNAVVLTQMHIEEGFLGVKAEKQPKPEEGKIVFTYFSQDHLEKAQEYLRPVGFTGVADGLRMTFDLEKSPIGFTPKDTESITFRLNDDQILTKDQSRLDLVVWELRNRFHIAVKTAGGFEENLPHSTEFVIEGNTKHLDASLSKLNERYGVEFIRTKDLRKFYLKKLNINTNTKQKKQMANSEKIQKRKSSDISPIVYDVAKSMNPPIAAYNPEIEGESVNFKLAKNKNDANAIDVCFMKGTKAERQKVSALFLEELKKNDSIVPKHASDMKTTITITPKDDLANTSEVSDDPFKRLQLAVLDIQKLQAVQKKPEVVDASEVVTKISEHFHFLPKASAFGKALSPEIFVSTEKVLKKIKK
jgi:hypothetical protein